MKFNISNIILLLASSFAFVSCDIEEINPNQIPYDEFWQDPENAEFALIGCYDALQQGALYRGGQNNNGIRDHDAISDVAYNNWATGLRAIASGEHDANNNIVNNFWDANYKGVGRCNDLIEGVADTDFDGKNEIVAEAKFLRALYYFHLTNYYGNVPYITMSYLKPPNTVDSAYYVTRTPRAESLDSIIADLNWAVDNLPIEGNNGKADKGAALGLLTRVYLHRASRANPYFWKSYDNKWEELTGEVPNQDEADAYYRLAISTAQRLMGAEFSYELLSDYASLFDGSSENSKESLFEVQFLSGEGEGEAYTGSWKNPQPWFVPSVEYVYSFYTVNGKTIADDNKIGPEDSTGIDPRYYVSVLKSGDQWRGNTWTGGGINYGDDPYLKFATKKYIRETGAFADGDRNFMVVRYADVLLMYAEAKVMLNEIDQSVYDAVDELRHRVGMDGVKITEGDGLTQYKFLEVIKHERAVEMALEGLRYQDLVRWNEIWRLNELVPSAGYTGGFPVKRYLWPVPQEECDNNRSKEGLQNPGWN